MESHLLQMRGLKRRIVRPNRHVIQVASFTDAWIETTDDTCLTISFESHLLQMRGLKLDFAKHIKSIYESHLLQMRGLKLNGYNGLSLG